MSLTVALLVSARRLADAALVRYSTCSKRLVSLVDRGDARGAQELYARVPLATACESK